MTDSPLATPDLMMTPAVFTNPYAAYRQFRDQSPVRYVVIPGGIYPGVDEAIQSWAFMKYADVMAALRDHDTFSSEDPLSGMISAKVVLLTDDPPRHTRLRRLVNKAFTLKRIESLEPWIRETANRLLDEMGTGEVEVVSRYTMPLPVKLIARLMGIPGEKYATFKQWTEAIMNMDESAIEYKMKSIEDVAAYFGQMAAQRRKDGAEDLITALVQAEIEGEQLKDWEILGFCVLLLVAGNDTTMHLMSNMFHILAGRPDLWRQMREDRSLVEPVIDETLRFESPVHRLSRFATRDVEVSGVKLKKGDRVDMFYGAANRDPAAYPDPDEFRLHRPDPSPHVAFGAGIHYCLGAPLARAEAKVSLNAFLDRFSVLKHGQTPAARQTTSPIVLGFKTLPLLVER